MSVLHGGYQGATRCTGQATPGARALMSWFLGAYGAQGAANLGIYVCKDIAGSSTTSLHGEGRAADLGTRPYARPPWGRDLADALVAHSAELGVQCVIHAGRIWSSSYPDAGWRPHHGSDPHNGHLHVELTWAAARTLTAERVQQVLTRPAVRPPVAPPKPVDWTKRIIMALPELKRGAGLTGPINEDVQSLQNLLQARGSRKEIDKAGGADGRFGKATDLDLRAFQRARKIKDDGVCGKVTWHHLLNQQKLL